MPQNRKMAMATIAIGVWIRENPMMVGATPNEIVLARLSSSLPKLFCCLSKRATLPSKKSATTANTSNLAKIL